MKRFLFALAIMFVTTLAHADTVPLATAGIWTTSGDATSATKVCVIQGEIALNGGIQMIGKLLLPKEDHGTVSITAKDNKLRLAVSKDAWHIRTITAPLVVSFPDGTSFAFVGIGEGNTISADLSDSDVKPFIHHFTKDDTATISFPQGREQPWTMSLTGTTPTIEALSKCADTAGMTLPYPFMRAAPAAPAVVTPPTQQQIDNPIPSLHDPIPLPPVPSNAQVSTYVPQPSPEPIAPIAEPPPAAGPDEQTFLATVSKYHADYSNASNEFQQGSIYQNRGNAFREVFGGGYKVTNWTGKVYKLSSNGDGYGIIEITLSDDAWVMTWNNSLSDFEDKTLISPNSPLYSKLGELKEGDSVVFSGQFFPAESADAADVVKTTDMMMDSKMKEPEFVFRFSSISKTN